MNRTLAAGIWLAAICLCPQARCQPAPLQAGGAERFAALGEFRLQDGTVLHDFRIGYRTLGSLNAEKSNAILWPTWLGGRSEDLLAFVGPANVVDTGKYFVILVDAIGDGITSSPSNSASQPLIKFPKFTIRDMVESQHRLAVDVLHLAHLHAVIGLSMGGMQAFEWAVAYPDFMDITITMAGSPQSTSYDKLLWTTEIDAIELDPAWNNGRPTGTMTRGIALAEEIDTMNATAPEFRTAQTSPGDFDAFLANIRKRATSDAGGAIDQIRQRQAIMALNIPVEFGIPLAQAAQRVRSKMLIIISPQDHTVNPTPALAFAKAIGAPVVTLNSACGHHSFSCLSIGPVVAQFLADSSAVHSQTLSDPANPTAASPSPH